ncbi:hypothetical protein [Streptomyces hayashii]|uniref:hypothetical protein n=1 Tax=Streptomyces hayashii TaxID=2839966 RepID=UPI00403CC73C
MPFNRLGNLAAPAELFRDLAKLGSPAVVTLINDAPRTTGLRWPYYRACEIDPLAEEPGSYGGTRFTVGRGFRSESFTLSGIMSVLNEAGLAAVEVASNQVGCCVTVNFE